MLLHQSYLVGSDVDGGLIDAENFGVNADLEEVFKERTEAPKPTIMSENGVDHLEVPVDMWAFTHPDKARIKSMRTIFSKFDVKMLILPDKVELQGQIR